jgi:hypothetical protein
MPLPRIWIISMKIVLICIIFINCTPYIQQRFTLSEQRTIIDIYGWKIAPYVHEQFLFENFDARVTSIRVVLPETTFSYDSSCWYAEDDSIGKKLYTYQVRLLSEKDVEKLPIIQKNVNKITVACEILYTSKIDGSIEKKEYSFELLRSDQKFKKIFFLI